MMIEKAIYPNPEEDLKHMMKVDDGGCPTGTRLLSALTRLEVLQRGEYDSKPATKLLLQLHTGKKKSYLHCKLKLYSRLGLIVQVSV